MALHTEPAWVREHKDKSELPLTDQELEQRRAWDRAVRTLNASSLWPPGTLQHLLVLADAEDDGA